MGKSSILKKIHNAAKNYQRYLAGKTFMYVYEGKSIEVVFKNSSFLHLTGVNTKLKAKEFYKHAKTKNGLKVQEFFFDKDHPYDLAEKKTDHLEDLYRITNMEVLITEDVVTFTANYKIGITDLGKLSGWGQIGNGEKTWKKSFTRRDECRLYARCTILFQV